MIYDEIHTFLALPDTTAADLIVFSRGLIESHPGERRFVQEWVLSILVTRFSLDIFDDVVLAKQHSFTLDPKNLQARIDYR